MGLIEDAAAARRAHMTYGQFKAQQPRILPPRRFSGLKKKPGATEKPLCEVCGKPVRERGRRYCCRECYLKARREEQK